MLYNQLPNKLFEYIAMGRPVVVGDVPSIRRAFADHEVLYYETGDAKQLAEGVLAHLPRPAAGAGDGGAGAETFRKYTWDVMRDVYVAIHDESSTARPQRRETETGTRHESCDIPSQSRGMKNSARRLGKISQRFGVSPGPMRGALSELVDICCEFGVGRLSCRDGVPDRTQPEFFETLRRGGRIFGVHGFVHTDHALLDERAQYEHLERALEAFEPLGMARRGSVTRTCATTRHLARRRQPRLHALQQQAVHWDVIDEELPPEALTHTSRGWRL